MWIQLLKYGDGDKRFQKILHILSHQVADHESHEYEIADKMDHWLSATNDLTEASIQKIEEIKELIGKKRNAMLETLREIIEDVAQIQVETNDFSD